MKRCMFKGDRCYGESSRIYLVPYCGGELHACYACAGDYIESLIRKPEGATPDTMYELLPIGRCGAAVEKRQRDVEYVDTCRKLAGHGGVHGAE
jgi:hypothetical protein